MGISLIELKDFPSVASLMFAILRLQFELRSRRTTVMGNGNNDEIKFLLVKVIIVIETEVYKPRFECKWKVSI